MTHELIEKICKKMFENLDFDAFLDSRDSSIFDDEWCRVYSEVEEQKEEKGYSETQQQETDNVREEAYRKVYDLCEDSELASYISDDFGLISDSVCVGYQDAWLDKMISCYQNAKLPCGKL